MLFLWQNLLAQPVTCLERCLHVLTLVLRETGMMISYTAKDSALQHRAYSSVVFVLNLLDDRPSLCGPILNNWTKKSDNKEVRGWTPYIAKPLLKHNWNSKKFEKHNTIVLYPKTTLYLGNIDAILRQRFSQFFLVGQKIITERCGTTGSISWTIPSASFFDKF